MSKIKPKHEALKEISLEIYKKLPKKNLCDKTIKFLLHNYPKSLVKILDSKQTSFYDKYMIIELMSFSKENDIIIDALLSYSKSYIPALREVSLFSASYFPVDKVIERLEEVEILEENLIIRDSVKLYLQEIFV